MSHIANCIICGEPPFAYVRMFDGQRKVGSYPACFAHYFMVWAYEQWGQDWVRERLARALPIRKGSVPRFRVGGRP